MKATHPDDMSDYKAEVDVGRKVAAQADWDDLDGVRDGTDDEGAPRYSRAHVAGDELRQVLRQEDEPGEGKGPDEAADHDLAVAKAVDEGRGDEDADDGGRDGAAPKGALRNAPGSASVSKARSRGAGLTCHFDGIWYLPGLT